MSSIISSSDSFESILSDFSDNYSSNSTDQRRIALVIGQNNYKNFPKLQSCIKDAQLMNQTLENLGFETTLLIDGTNDEIKQGFLGLEIEEDDLVFLYYSGHAFQQSVKNKTDNYLLGIDAQKIQKGKEEIIKGVSLHEKVLKLWFSEKCTYLVVIDACRSFPSTHQRFKGGSSSRPQVHQSQMTLAPVPANINQGAYDVVFACQPGYSAIDVDDGQVGLLAKALSTAMSTLSTWRDVYGETINQVVKQSKGQQKPQVYVNIGNTIYMNPKHDTIQTTIIQQQIAIPDFDEDFFIESDIITLKNCVKNGLVFNQLIEIDKQNKLQKQQQYYYDNNNDNKKSIITSVLKHEKDQKILIKQLKIVFNNPSEECQYFVIQVQKGQEIKIEDCYFEGIGLYVVNNNINNKNYNNNYNKNNNIDENEACGKISMERVQIIDAPDEGLKFQGLESVKMEHVFSKNCNNIGFNFLGIANVEIQSCKILQCDLGLNFENDQKFSISTVHVGNCSNTAFSFQGSEGTVKDCRIQRCKIGIEQKGDSQIEKINVEEE